MKTSWWKYVFAVFVFISLFFLAPIVLYWLCGFVNIFLPKRYVSSEGWLLISSGVMAMFLTIEVTSKIVPNNHKFLMVLFILCAFYCVAVGFWNFALEITDIYALISMLARAAVSVAFAVFQSREIDR